MYHKTTILLGIIFIHKHKNYEKSLSFIEAAQYFAWFSMPALRSAQTAATVIAPSAPHPPHSSKQSRRKKNGGEGTHEARQRADHRVKRERRGGGMATTR